MQTFAVAAGVVALAEIGDKTQLLALLLAARFRRPIPIVLGILTATLLNHAAAGALGAALPALVDPEFLRWALAATFVAMAVWVLVPDTAHAPAAGLTRAGVYAATTVAFFLAEMGDKTQLATVMLAARYPDLPAVVGGTTLGMLIANVPVVWLGERAAGRIPLRPARAAAGATFAALGLLALLA